MESKVNGKQFMVPVGVVVVVASMLFGLFEWVESEVQEEIRFHSRNVHVGAAKESDVSKLEMHLIKIEELIRDTRERVIRLESRNE